MFGWYPVINEEEKLKSILASCDEILEREPDNQWWKNFRQQAQERLEEIYQADHYDDVADFRLCEEVGLGL